MSTFTEESTTGVIVQSGVTGAAITFFSDAVISMTPYLIVSLILILVDLYFGVKAALHRGETVRISRAFRRTVGKMFEYLCWVMVSVSLAVAFEVQFLVWIILGFVMGNEVLSIITNWLESHNKRIVGFNPFKVVGEKIGVDLSDVHIEEKDKPASEKPKPQKRKPSAKKCPDNIIEDID
jgi:hypothetical protein